MNLPIDSINMRSAISERCVRFSWLRKCSPAAQPLKPVGGEIAFCAIESSVASFGLRLTSRREASDDSPCRVSPPHRTRNGSAVTKGHEKVWVEFRRFGKFGRGCTEKFMQAPLIFRLLFTYAYTIIYAMQNKKSKPKFQTAG